MVIASTAKWVEVSRYRSKTCSLLASAQMIVFTGRTTTGMIVSSIIASIDRSDDPLQMALDQEDSSEAQLNSSVNLDDISEETIYKRGSSSKSNGKAEYTHHNNLYPGEYKMVLQLVSVLLHGREAKLIADRAADVISGVQNLREAVYE